MLLGPTPPEVWGSLPFHPKAPRLGPTPRESQLPGRAPTGVQGQDVRGALGLGAKPTCGTLRASGRRPPGGPGRGGSTTAAPQAAALTLLL